MLVRTAVGCLRYKQRKRVRLPQGIHIDTTQEGVHINRRHVIIIVFYFGHFTSPLKLALLLQSFLPASLDRVTSGEAPGCTLDAQSRLVSLGNCLLSAHIWWESQAGSPQRLTSNDATAYRLQS
jgi:hypothetical protein